MPEINLLQPESSSIAATTGTLSRGLFRLLTILVVLALALYGLLFFLNWQNSSKKTSIEKQITAVQGEVSSNKNRNEVLTRQEQLAQLETLITNHSYWSVLLPELARVTLKSAHYTSITAERDGTLQLAADLPSYADVEKFMQIFDLPEYNKEFSNVKIMSLGKSEKDSILLIQLRLQLKFNPEFLKGKA